MQQFDPQKSLADMRHEFGEHGGVNMSIEASTTFTVVQADIMPEMFQGQRGPEAGGCYLYGRHFNPTVYVLGRQLAALEGTQAGYCTASGMSAISAVVMQLCQPGDHVVSAETIYGGTFALFREFLPAKMGLDVSFVNTSDHQEVENAFTPKTKLLYVETMANPTLAVADIPALSEIAHRHQALLVVDNTFCPLVVTPARLGADVVIHSLTKFINGASDIIAGAICADSDFIMKLMDLHCGALMLLGPTMDPKAAFSVSLRIPHLGLRMVEHSRRALTFAQRLEELNIPVAYPGLPSHPDHLLLKRIGNAQYGYGGILAIDLGDGARADALMELLQNKDRFGFMAVSLGFFETLMSRSQVSTSSEMSKEDQNHAGIAPGLIRMSIGYTGTVEQRWKQFEDALRSLNFL